MIMSQPGALAPLVYGGKVRAIMVYLDRMKLQARHLSPLDVLKAVDDYNVFLPTGSAKFGDTDYAIDSQLDVRPRRRHGARSRCATSTATRRLPPRRRRRRRTPTSSRPTSCASTAGGRSTSRSSASSAPARSQVVDTLKGAIETMKARLTRPGIDLKVVMDQSVYVRSRSRAWSRRACWARCSARW